ncbi:MAG: enoyl-CoA hydratase/isomerase family protein [Gammaproteobacteria bacterium]|nr:enoyl-CoA hydratase/isomerase family protein [Gammaproteobacteria bacterium]
MLQVDEREGGLLHLTLHRPRQHNALNFALLDELRGTLENHAQDAALKCVIITGAGDKSFCAGGDLHELDSMRSLDDAREISRIGRRALDQVRYFPVPVAAALNGDALGGGAELALACDYSLAAGHARLGFLQARLNLMTAWGGAADVIARCGSARGMGLLLGAKRMSAVEALEAGLIDEVCEERQTVDDLALAWSAAMMERSRAVLRGQKALAIIMRRRMHDALSEAEEQHMANAWTDPAHWEAVRRSFSAKKS